MRDRALPLEGVVACARRWRSVMEPWVVRDFGQIIEVEDPHVNQWRVIANGAEDWLRLQIFDGETPDEVRHRRTEGWNGLSWAEALAAPRSLWLANLPWEFVLVNDAGTVLVAIALERGACIAASDEPAVAINLARASTSAADGAALAVVREIPAFLRINTGSVEHVIADVCTQNSASLKLFRRVGWRQIGSGECEYHHPKVDCREKSEVFCSHS